MSPIINGLYPVNRHQRGGLASSGMPRSLMSRLFEGPQREFINNQISIRIERLFAYAPWPNPDGSSPMAVTSIVSTPSTNNGNPFGTSPAHWTLGCRRLDNLSALSAARVRCRSILRRHNFYVMQLVDNIFPLMSLEQHYSFWSASTITLTLEHPKGGRSKSYVRPPIVTAW